VHITVYCPRCNGRYYVDYHMRGKRMRCPNPVCRETFAVQEVSEPAAPGPGEPPQPVGEDIYGFKPENAPLPPSAGRMTADTVHLTGDLGGLVPILGAEPVEDPNAPAGQQVDDVVPLLSAEIVTENLPPEPRETASWQEPPPVRNPQAPLPAEPEPSRAAPTGRQSRPRPTRSSPETAVPRKTEVPSAPVTAASESIRAPETMLANPGGPVELPPGAWEAPPVRRTGATTASEQPLAEAATSVSTEDVYLGMTPTTGRHGALIMAIMAVIVLVVAFVVGGFAVNYFTASEGKLYEQAVQEYDKHNFTGARDLFQRLRKDYPSSENSSAYLFYTELSDLREVIGGIETEPDAGFNHLKLFREGHKTEPLFKQRQVDLWESLHQLVKQFTTKAEEKHDPTLVVRAEEAFGLAHEYEPNTAPGEVKAREATKLIANAKGVIARWNELQAVLESGERLKHNKPTVGTVRDWRQLVHSRKFDKEPTVLALSRELDLAVQQEIRWDADAKHLESGGASDAPEPSLQVVTLVGGPETQSPPGDRVVPTVARGVLNALSQKSGEVLWSMRVGIDTAALPVLLPATPTTPELYLVVSAEDNTLRALVARTGTALWRYQLPAPCLGQPVVVKGRAYVPTFDGKVHEIEIFAGNRLGHFDLGQPLTVGGAWQPGTNLLYFPGDSQNIYVLDRVQKKCVAILQSGHPSGALRSAPIVVNRVDPLARGDANAPVPGYLILSQTDGLNHIKLRVYNLPIERPDAPPILLPEPRVPGWSWFQPYYDPEKLAVATDAGMFGLYGINQVRNEDKPLFPSLPEEVHLGQATASPGRAQVVHADENDFWVLSRGALQRLQYNWFKQAVAPLWERPLDLGSPLHAGQWERDEKGTTLFVVTQAQRPRACLATAITAEDGRIRWQRQLGLDCPSDPLVLGQEVLALDRSGSLFSFDPAEHAGRLRPWQKGGRRVAEPLELGVTPPLLLPGPNGTSAYEIVSSGLGKQLAIRRCEAGKKEVTSTFHDLVAPLAGTPALGTDILVLPLANGKLVRLFLRGGVPESGPDWRSPQVDEDARGFVVHIGGNEFLYTDGLRGLIRQRWSGDVPGEARTVELPARIVAPPVVLPRADEKAELQVCVADAEGTLTLLQGDEVLKPQRTWRLQGKSQVTSGPFLRGRYVGCVLERRHLLWIDPALEKIAWTFEAAGDGIVGQPQIVEGVVVVADLAGHFTGLNPATGNQQGKGYVSRPVRRRRPRPFPTAAAGLSCRSPTVRCSCCRCITSAVCRRGCPWCGERGHLVRPAQSWYHPLWLAPVQGGDRLHVAALALGNTAVSLDRHARDARPGRAVFSLLAQPLDVARRGRPRRERAREGFLRFARPPVPLRSRAAAVPLDRTGRHAAVRRRHLCLAPGAVPGQLRGLAAAGSARSPPPAMARGAVGRLLLRLFRSIALAHLRSQAVRRRRPRGHAPGLALLPHTGNAARRPAAPLRRPRSRCHFPGLSRLFPVWRAPRGAVAGGLARTAGHSLAGLWAAGGRRLRGVRSAPCRADPRAAQCNHSGRLAGQLPGLGPALEHPSLDISLDAGSLPVLHGAGGTGAGRAGRGGCGPALAARRPGCAPVAGGAYLVTAGRFVRARLSLRRSAYPGLCVAGAGTAGRRGYSADAGVAATALAPGDSGCAPPPSRPDWPHRPAPRHPLAARGLCRSGGLRAGAPPTRRCGTGQSLGVSLLLPRPRRRVPADVADAAAARRPTLARRDRRQPRCTPAHRGDLRTSPMADARPPRLYQDERAPPPTADAQRFVAARRATRAAT
jgi:outer membrane protein assembly factor BamB